MKLLLLLLLLLLFFPPAAAAAAERLLTSTSALMTLPRALRDLLMFAPSFRVAPVAPVLFTYGELVKEIAADSLLQQLLLLYTDNNNNNNGTYNNSNSKHSNDDTAAAITTTVVSNGNNCNNNNNQAENWKRNVICLVLPVPIPQDLLDWSSRRHCDCYPRLLPSDGPGRWIRCVCERLLSAFICVLAVVRFPIPLSRIDCSFRAFSTTISNICINATHFQRSSERQTDRQTEWNGLW